MYSIFTYIWLMFMVNVGKYMQIQHTWILWAIQLGVLFFQNPHGFRGENLRVFFGLLSGQLGIPGGGLRFLRICCRLEDGSYVSYGDSSFDGSGVLLGESKETPSFAFWAAASEEAPGRELVRVVR